MNKIYALLIPLFLSMGLQALESQSMQMQPQPQNQSWSDWGRQKFQTARHYMPSWYYAPAVGAGIGTVASSLGFKRFSDYEASLKSILPLIAMGLMAQMSGQLPDDAPDLGPIYPDTYKYYLPGVIAGMSALLASPYLNNVGLAPWLASPLLLGAGHLAHQYNYPPVVPVNNQPQVPVAQPEQLPLTIKEGQ